MDVEVFVNGPSRSFPGVVPTIPGCGVILAGIIDDHALATAAAGKVDFVAIELGIECLAHHIGLDADKALAKIVGFARFRLGTAEPTNLIELVATSWTDKAAVAAARAAFEAAGFVVASCADRPGRIVNRLIRPYFNAVLRRLDDRLATAEDMDTTLRLGLGYPSGPNALLTQTGLADHCDISEALHIALGDPDFAPARRAQVARHRARM